ncbi:MAG: cell envelope integrity protein CreD [Henriciella sp.]|nr:cell envelope integrity protein CreD [Henriciella sp.]
MTNTETPTSPLPPGEIPPALSALLPKRSAGLKLLLVCALAVVMIIPAMLVYGVVNERSEGLELAVSEVSESVGGAQSVLGPVLAVPYLRRPDATKPDAVVYGIAIAYAETGRAQAEVTVTERQRGIHTIPVFDSQIRFDAEFDPAALRNAVPPDAEAIWPDARLYVGVSDTRGIKDVIGVTVQQSDGRRFDVAMEPANRTTNGDGYEPVPHTHNTLAGGEIPGLETLQDRFRVSADLRLSGARRLAMGPFAKTTELHMTSNWEAPSFGGGVLPDTHTAGASDEGFSATWRVPYLARGIAGAGPRLNLSEVTQWNNRDMAVRFLKEVSPYQSVERALKYAAMFIGFVFLAYFLFEVTSGARAHPAQYVLVGLAQTIFYLLLLAFSERVGFDIAFAIAAVLTVGLTALYAMAVFQSRTYGLRALGIMAGIYTLIYVLMRAEDHALLAGALASFAAIALTMFMTRNVDWYGEGKPAPA